MPESYNSISEAFSAEPGSGWEPTRTPSPQKSKTIKELITFYLANGVVLPPVVFTSVTIASDGLQQLLGIMSFKLWRSPIPGAELMRSYSGFSKLTLAHPLALILFIAVSMAWFRIFRIAQEPGLLEKNRKNNPLNFWAVTGIFGTLLSSDSIVFYMGVAAQSGSGWADTPLWVPAAATGLYTCLLAGLSLWHVDFHHAKSR